MGFSKRNLVLCPLLRVEYYFVYLFAYFTEFAECKFAARSTLRHRQKEVRDFIRPTNVEISWNEKF